MDEMDQQMAGGHCFGFSVAADLVWGDEVSTSAFGAPTINSLAIDNNANLQSTIAEGWVYQTLDSVQAKKITGTPNQMLDELEKAAQAPSIGHLHHRHLEEGWHRRPRRHPV